MAKKLSVTNTVPSSFDWSDDDLDAYNEEKLKPPEKEVIIEEGQFVHETGDTYDGFFEAKKKDYTVKMHGMGTYTTNEGDVYTGTWDADVLGREGCTISYVSGAKYEGRMKDWAYTGNSTYTYPDSSTLKCDFENDCPVGQLSLTDPNGHNWVGVAEQGYAWLEPVNHYYELLETTLARQLRVHRKPVPVVKTTSKINRRKK